jgi:hypothetical protein
MSSYALAATAFVMGLAGGPHCTAMCGAACGGIVRAGRSPNPSPWLFQAGRLAGYSIAGAISAEVVQSLAWMTSRAAALQPVWTLFHVAVLAWGLVLLALARQPMWVSDAGRRVWTRVRPLAGARGGQFAAGTMWAAMPCGLMYSALLVASLTGDAAGGALAMGLFAIGSGLWLAAAPRLFIALRQKANLMRKDWGTRISGLLLVVAAVFALWMDLAHRIAQWCGVA